MDTYTSLMILIGHWMRLPLTKLENIALIILTTPPLPSLLCLLLLVRPGGYTVNLLAFYFYKIIGKLNSSLEFQEFSQRNPPVVCTTLNACRSPHNSRTSAKNSHQVFITEDHPERWWHTCDVQITHSPITLANCSFVNLVYVFRYYGSSHHIVYVRRVHPSSSFSLASHRLSNLSLLFSSHFIDS